METSFDNKCHILAEVWLEYRQDEEFTDFVEYNDLGLPLAYALSNSIVKVTPQAKKFVNETFDLLLAGLDLEDSGFETIADLLDK
jgi:methylthioribose-1-phosphate isomerase